MNIKSIVKTAWSGAKENAPLIFAIGGLVAAGVTVYTAVKEAPKAKLKMAEAKLDKEEKIREELPPEKKNTEIVVKLSTAEKIAIIFKCCWPAIVSAVLTVGCTTASQIAAGKQIKAARFAENVAQKKLENYVAETVDKLGDKKTDEIKDGAAERAMNANPPKTDKNGNIIAYGKGSILFYDPQMNVYFWAEINRVDKAVNYVDAEILEGEFVTVREFYDEIDPSIELPSVSKSIGFGAKMDEIAKSAFLSRTYSRNSAEVTEDGEVRVILNYTARDRHTYKDYIPDEEE